MKHLYILFVDVNNNKNIERYRRIFIIDKTKYIKFIHADPSSKKKKKIYSMVSPQ